MPFTIADFVALRPYLYHLTARANLPVIQKTGQLESAERLLARGGQKHLITVRRPDSVNVVIDGDSVSVRDQRPLYKGNIEFKDDWMFPDVIRHLNQHVFFWPGGADGVINYGERHFARYHEGAPVVLRISTHEIIEANPTSPPRFCRYNSGSPRCVAGKKSPRGEQTFQDGELFPFSPGKVVEVVFQNSVTLPRFEVGRFNGRTWIPDSRPSANLTVR